MPSWKKVIVSGSDASLNSLNVINGITGSLLGTSSYASNADLLDGLNSTAFVLNTQTSSFVQNSQTSSFATFTALNAYTSSINTYTSSLNTKTSSFVLNSQTSSFVQNSQTSSFATFTALNAYTSSINTYTSSLNSKTSSFATTGSNNFIGTQSITGSLNVTGALNISSASFEYQQNLSVTTGSARVIASIATGSDRAAFFDYVITSGSNARAGTVFSVWSGSVVEWNDVSTNDIGNTTDVTVYAAITGSNVALLATSSINFTWAIKSLVRAI
jgi:hypothetical protein